MKRLMAIGVLLVGVVSLELSSVFIVQATGTSVEMKAGLVDQNVILRLPTDENGSTNRNVVDTSAKLEAAQEILLEHMRTNYGTHETRAEIHPNVLDTWMALLL